VSDILALPDNSIRYTGRMIAGHMAGKDACLTFEDKGSDIAAFDDNNNRYEAWTIWFRIAELSDAECERREVYSKWLKEFPKVGTGGDPPPRTYDYEDYIQHSLRLYPKQNDPVRAEALIAALRGAGLDINSLIRYQGNWRDPLARAIEAAKT
jgi:hypothetical protein